MNGCGHIVIHTSLIYKCKCLCPCTVSFENINCKHFIQSPHISNRVTGLMSFSHPQVADLWSVLQPHGECPEETGRANSHTGGCQD